MKLVILHKPFSMHFTFERLEIGINFGWEPHLYPAHGDFLSVHRDGGWIWHLWFLFLSWRGIRKLT
jgi:hypothetical protein